MYLVTGRAPECQRRRRPWLGLGCRRSYPAFPLLCFPGHPSAAQPPEGSEASGPLEECPDHGPSAYRGVQCVRRSPAAAVSVIASGHTSTEPILRRWRATVSGQPESAVLHAAGFPWVGACYTQSLGRQSLTTLSKSARSKHLQNKVQRRV
jgi:hypothetical protein